MSDININGDITFGVFHAFRKKTICKDITLEDWLDGFGITKPTLYDYENGKRPVPYKIGRLMAIDMNVPIEEVLDENGFMRRTIPLNLATMKRNEVE